MKTPQDQYGFTLIEMLIVIIILGILAMVLISQFTLSTEDSKLNSLKTNLKNLRSTIQIYNQQHNNTYPGERKADGSGVVTSVEEAQTAFVEQLTRYTNKDGKTSVSGTTEYPYGPYIKGSGIPKNPFNEKNSVICDITATNITTRDSDNDDAGWKFYVNTGVLIAADKGAHDDL